MSSAETIVVVGAAGDLGTKIRKDLARSSIPALFLDLAHKIPSHADSSIWTADLESLAGSSSLLHWCAPLSEINQLKSLSPGELLVLHDSDMSASRETADLLREKKFGSVAVVHYLSNEQGVICVDKESDELNRIIKHILALRRVPYVESVEAHTERMVWQAFAAAILKSERGSRLVATDPAILSPSVQDFVRFLKHRDLKWTKETLDSLLGSRKLKVLVREISASLPPDNTPS